MVGYRIGSHSFDFDFDFPTFLEPELAVNLSTSRCVQVCGRKGIRLIFLESLCDDEEWMPMNMRSTLQKTYSHMTYSGTYTCTTTDFYFYKSPQKRRRASLLFFSCILRTWLKEILQNNYELKCLG